MVMVPGVRQIVDLIGSFRSKARQRA